MVRTLAVTLIQNLLEMIIVIVASTTAVSAVGMEGTVKLFNRGLCAFQCV